ncbi:MAG: mycothiol synthase [Mycobacteriales bacterium]
MRDTPVAEYTRLEPGQVAEVGELLAAATDADGVSPLSEHVLLHLRHGGDVEARHLLARVDGRLVGYAHLDVTDLVEGSSAEMAVHPGYRRHGLGRALLENLLADTPDGRLRLWAHGEHPGAVALAAAYGFRRSRVLWQMRRSLYAPVPRSEYPPDVTVRPFRVGTDEERWLAVNNRAFARHPDQGRWTVADVRAREAEPWFDPAGFFLAEREGELVGFHWTKVHGAGDHEHEPIGEVYVVGVDPSAQGTGLGTALVLTGLLHLRAAGLAEVMLYVDESNRGAVRVYEKLGFTHWDTDVTFRHP